MGGSRLERADKVLVSRKAFTSREKAQVAIEEGRVFIDRRPVTRSSTLVAADASIEVTPSDEYVSRGALKLQAAFENFGLSAKGRVVLDAGASTGGFSDYVLRAGARKVIAVDVGYGQFAWKLRNDPRVELHERTNIRYLTPAEVSEVADMAVVDLSFISVTKVLTALSGLVRPGSEVVVLVKPQFEVGPGSVGKGGIVREPRAHLDALEQVISAAVAAGFAPRAVTYSPIKGADGNIEYLIMLQPGAEEIIEGGDLEARMREVVKEAHEALGRHK